MAGYKVSRIIIFNDHIRGNEATRFMAVVVKGTNNRQVFDAVLHTRR
jgi:hypothetical protein